MCVGVGNQNKESIKLKSSEETTITHEYVIKRLMITILDVKDNLIVRKRKNSIITIKSFSLSFWTIIIIINIIIINVMYNIYIYILNGH